MRQLSRIATVLALPAAAVVGCASAGTLPGGPPDEDPPEVVGFTPDSGTVGYRGRAVTVQFDETISDRGTGANALEALVLISPREGEPRISWSRNRIAVRPRDGFRPNTPYRITIGPGIADIRGNRSAVARSVVFSTGPTIPDGAISGIAFDWPGQALARTAFVEALRVPDSTVFVAPVDSSGRFTVAPLPPGTYVVRGYVDQNRNRVLDRAETWDSVRVAVAGGAAPPVELLLAQRDTMPAGLQTVALLDSTAIAFELDRPLDPAQEFTPAQVRVVRADSTPVAVTALMTRAAFDSARRRAALDAAVRDTAARDTAARDTAARPIRDTARAAPADTLAAPVRPSRPAPPRAFVVALGEPLQPGATYRLTVTGFRSLLGRAAPSTRTITVPERPAPAAAPPAAPPDTTTRRPPARPGAR